MYVYELRWEWDETSTFVIIEAETEKEAKKRLKEKCNEKEWSTTFTRCVCKRLILEDGFFCIN